MVPMSDEERRALIQEVVAYTEPPILERDEFTRSDYSDEASVGTSGTKNRLERLVDEGVLKKRMVFDPRTRRQVWAYRKVDESSPTSASSDNRELADQDEETLT